MGHAASGNTAPFVGDLDCDVLASLHDNDFDRWEVVLVIRTVSLDDGA